MAVLGGVAFFYERDGSNVGAFIRTGKERVLYWRPTGPNPLYHRDVLVGQPRSFLYQVAVHSLFQVAFHLPC